MRFLLLFLLLVVAGFMAWRLLGRRSPGTPQQDGRPRGLPERPSSVRVVPTAEDTAAPMLAAVAVAPAALTRTTSITPPSTLGLDDPDAVRPDLDEDAMASARTLITPAVPDAVLSDALLDATPEQLQHLFAAVPQDVMANALGDDVGLAGPLAESEKAQLSGLGDELDTLDIWDFGADDGTPDPQGPGHKA